MQAAEGSSLEFIFVAGNIELVKEIVLVFLFTVNITFYLSDSPFMKISFVLLYHK